MVLISPRSQRTYQPNQEAKDPQKTLKNPKESSDSNKFNSTMQ